MARRMKYDVEAKEEAKDGEGGFLSRWSARKSQIAKGEDVPDEVPAPEIADDAAVEDDEDAALTDAELLEKYDLPDPATVTEESGLEQFLNGKGLPGRVRQMALRRLWRLNPLFGIVDDMVEYGEDYTDAATVIEGMKTAYTVGKGYAKEVVEPEETETKELPKFSQNEQLREILRKSIIILDEKKIAKQDHGSKLAGNVSQEFKLEEQFIMSSGLGKFLSNSVLNWLKFSGINDIKNFYLISSWIVRQFENEYNPIHWHKGHVSGVGYLKLPKTFGTTKQPHDKKNQNGKINFTLLSGIGNCSIDNLFSINEL